MRDVWLMAVLLAVPSDVCSGQSRAGFAGELRVGAARVDITPAADAALPMAGYAGRTQGFRGIHDPLYVRAIVLSDGATEVALVAWESLFVPDQVWAETSQQIAKATGIPADGVLLSAVHTHAAPTLAPAEPSAQQLAYRTTIQNAAVDAVRRAKAQLQPARFGIGRATAHVNINRREFSAGRGWWLGFNDEGPSDKTVTVLRFEDLTGRPIALWINYAVHAVIMGPENFQISGDVAGATSQFVERHYAGSHRPRSDAGMRLRLRPEEKPTAEGVVAVWTSGAAGDQNPVSMASGEDFTLVEAMGKVLGEAAVRAASTVKTTAAASLRSVQKVVTCPGRRVDPGQTPRADYTFKDADPVDIRLSLVTINDIALAGVSGEVFTLIAHRLQKEAPSRQVVMVTHSNGSSGYIPNDAAFEPVSYEVTASRLKPGCAEHAIVSGFLESMRVP